MQKNRIETIRKIISVITAVYTVFIAVCFTVKSIQIFSLGETPFSLENILTYFSGIKIFVWIYLVFLAIGAIFMMIFPAKRCEKRTVAKDITKKSEAENKSVEYMRVVILLIGILFVVLGIVNGGMRDVLEKAIKICTECIGLG